MQDVVQTIDEFGAYLAKLRADRGISGLQLGKVVGKSPDYIGGWEREKRPVNKAILHQVCAALDLNEAERQQLLTLADRRNLPDDAPRTYPPREQIQLNVHAALSDVLQAELPDKPARHVQTILPLGDCASWALCYYAAGCLGHSPDMLKWPDAVYNNRIVDPKWKAEAENVFPADLVSELFPAPAAEGDLDEPLAYNLGSAMAELFRRWYLSDLDRCRKAARGLRRWSLSDDPEIGPVVTLRFADPDQEEFDIRGIRAVVATANLRRQFTAFVWEFANGRLPNDRFREYPTRFDVIDSMSYTAYVLAKCYLKYSEPVMREHLQAFRDALFTIQSGAWHSVGAVAPLMRLIATSDLHADDTRLPADTEIRKLATMPYEQQLAAYPLAEKVRTTMVDTLELAERKMTRAFQAAERPSPKPGPDHKDRRKRRKTERKERKKSKRK